MVSGNTSVLGLIGDPVGHSLSTFMHNTVFKQLNLDYVYVPFNVKKENLSDAILGAKGLNIAGLNVTIPHKINVINYIDEIDSVAEMIGAVNTIKFNNGKAIGYNTDGVGAIKGLQEISSLKDKKVIILGAGGSSRAVGFQLAISGINELLITNRNIEKAKILTDDFKAKLRNTQQEVFPDFNNEMIFNHSNFSILKNEIKDADILINATPLGLYPNVNPDPIIKSDILHSDLIVYDLIYNPLETITLKEAKKAKTKTISGIKMLVHQGATSLKIWTGVDAPIDTMEKTVINKLVL
ncbi:MAG: shikimate dehydrogenase [Methanobrevibacter sp.]|jgi:shikimate dehydrogenase|nr:shikimate dehydrogenase [Methanobrevibacter sp.]